MIIKGSALSPAQLRLVLAAFVHRQVAIGPDKHYPSEQAWVIDHAFVFVKDGSRLSHRARYALPHFLADTPKAVR